jgi:adenylate cyclase
LTVSELLASGLRHGTTSGACGVIDDPRMIERDHGRTRLHMSRTPNSATADLQQANADLQRQLAEARAERDESEAQKSAITEVLGVINSSPGDLAPVFDTMLERALRLCGAAFGFLQMYDGECFHNAAARPLLTRSEPIRTTPGMALYPIACGEPVLHIADLRDDPVYRSGNQARRQLVDVDGARTALWVALHKDEAVLGVIVIYRREVRLFTDNQIALLQNFAAQAVIAMENARLITETREALEQQTATAEVLGVINSSPGDLTPVFDVMLERAMHLCGAAFGELLTYDGERFRDVATRGVPTAFAEYRRHGNAPPGPGSLGARVLAGERGIYVADLKSQEVYLAGDANRRALVDLGGARAALAASLRKDDAVLGFMILYRQEVQPFTDKQIALLENFAAQAVIAMENARLLTETREALDQQTATAEVLGVINSSPKLQPVFDAILSKAHTLCGATQGALFLREGEHWRAVAGHGGEGVLERMRQGFHGSDAPVSRPLLAGDPFVHIADLAQIDHPLAHAAVELAGSRTVLSVPLRKGEALLGMILAARREVQPFSDKQIALLQNFAAQAVIAMENARLVDELRQTTEEVAKLNRGLEARVAEQVEELGRVGRLKRFLAPQLAELIVSQGDEKILESHRREIVVVFCDLRGYTAFTETAEPEEVLDFLREYHGALGPLVSQFEGTLDQFSGDGIMVLFNDPVPIPDPAERAVRMAMVMREAAGQLIAAWRPRGCELGFGVGIAWGYATLGQIGFSDRSGYTAIGTVCNVAARLCAEAKDGQILVSGRVAAAVASFASFENLGNLELKGLIRPVEAFNVVQSTSAADARPNLTVVASTPGT